nr:unnamed protein product [Callosobruchus chinensis]
MKEDASNVMIMQLVKVGNNKTYGRLQQNLEHKRVLQVYQIYVIEVYASLEMPRAASGINVALKNVWIMITYRPQAEREGFGNINKIRVQRRAIRLIGDPALTCHFRPLSRRRGVLLVTSHFATVIQTDSNPLS